MMLTPCTQCTWSEQCTAQCSEHHAVLGVFGTGSIVLCIHVWGAGTIVVCTHVCGAGTIVLCTYVWGAGTIVVCGVQAL